jgi:hypothetical protein
MPGLPVGGSTVARSSDSILPRGLIWQSVLPASSATSPSKPSSFYFRHVQGTSEPLSPRWAGFLLCCEALRGVLQVGRFSVSHGLEVVPQQKRDSKIVLIRKYEGRGDWLSQRLGHNSELRNVNRRRRRWRAHGLRDEGLVGMWYGPQGAGVIAAAMIDADLAGVDTHGAFRLEQYGAPMNAIPIEVRCSGSSLSIRER